MGKQVRYNLSTRIRPGCMVCTPLLAVRGRGRGKGASPPMTRTFLAIELPDDARTALARERDRLAREFPSIRWVDLASLHLTLAFLGELDDEGVRAAEAAALEAATSTHPFSLALAGLGTFGSPRAPRVVWAGIVGVASVQRLHAALADALAQRGFPREEGPFAPHLTLARIKDRLDPTTLDRLHVRVQSATGRSYASWRVEAISTMKSELLRGGARYTQLAEARLGNR